MRLRDLAKLCDRPYDSSGDTTISEYITEGGQLVDPPPQGDTLALFIASELHDTYDNDATTSEQLAEAVRCMGTASDQLAAVYAALGNYTPPPDPRREIAEAAVGRELADGELSAAVAAYEDLDFDTLSRKLRDAVTVFEAQGGRGVELADDIDRMRIALGVRTA